MKVNAKEVKKLRDTTGAGMMDAKKALQESKGDLEEAIKYLRKKGLSDSKKRVSKDANEGVIGSYTHMQQGRAVSGVLVELACETDFVAKSEEFINLSQQIAMHIAAMKPLVILKEEITKEDIENEKEILFGLDDNNIQTQTQPSTMSQILSEVDTLDASPFIREEIDKEFSQELQTSEIFQDNWETEIQILDAIKESERIRNKKFESESITDGEIPTKSKKIIIKKKKKKRFFFF